MGVIIALIIAGIILYLYILAIGWFFLLPPCRYYVLALRCLSS